MDDGDRYIENCQEFDTAVDASVVVALKTQWHVLQPTTAFCEGCLLPLHDILDRNQHITKLSLRGAGATALKAPSRGNGNSNARILGLILRKNSTIQDLDLSQTGLDEEGLAEICAALHVNRAVRTLNLSWNHFGSKGAEMLRDMMLENPTLEELNVNCNGLTYQAIHTLRQGLQHQPHRRLLAHHGNFVFEEILNAMSHGIGFLFSVIGCYHMMARVQDPHPQHHVAACATFSASLLFLYLSSTLLHSFFMLPSVMWVLRIVDKCAIYLLIAGTYTPITVIALPRIMGRVILGMEWMVALCGVLFTITADNRPSSPQQIIQVTIYATMGLAITCVWPTVREVLPPRGQHLLVAGGAAYLGGIIFFVLDKRKPIFHSVWHLFVLVGSTFHWFCIYKYIVPL